MQYEHNEEKDRKTEEILKYYSALGDRSAQDNIVAMLRELQEVNGYIGPVLIEQAASAAGVKPTVIQVILKRYPSLKPAPFFHEIIVCTGGSCAAKGSLELLKDLKNRLNIKSNGISGDGKVCVRTRNCLKSCGSAPNILVDGVLCSGKTVDDIIKILRNRG